MSDTNTLVKIHDQFSIDKNKDKASILISDLFKNNSNLDHSLISIIFGHEFLPLQVELKWQNILSTVSSSSLHMMVLANLIMINQDFKEEAYLGCEFLKKHKKEQFESLKEEGISYYLEIQNNTNSRVKSSKESILKYFEFSISGSPFYDEIVSRFNDICIP